MSMRRFRLLVEHYRVLNMLLENREEAILKRFVPILANMVDNLYHGELQQVAACQSDKMVEMPTPIGGLTKVSVVRLASQTPAIVRSFTDDQRAIRAQAIASAIIALWWNADPTPKKQYVTWLLTRYCGKDAAARPKLEDRDRISGYLGLFEQVKNKLPPEQRDINRFRSPGELFDAIKDYREDESGAVVSNSYEQQMYEQSELIYQGSDYEILSPKTKDAAIYFGRGTEWCTAYAPPRTNNMFHHYADESPLYIVKDKSTGERWQFWLGRNPQYMDTADRPIRISEFVTQHPKVNDIFNQYLGVTGQEPFDRWDDYDVFLRDGNSGFKVLAVAPKGYVANGLVRTREECTITANAETGRIVGADVVDDRFASDYDALARSVKKAGFWGNCTQLTFHNIFWSEDKGMGGVEVLPVIMENTNNVAVRCDYSDEHYTIMTYHADMTDDVFDLDVQDDEFKFNDYTAYSRVNSYQSEKDFLVDVMLKHLPENLKRDVDGHRLPDDERLVDQRPQWCDLGMIARAKGQTPEVLQRTVDWLIACGIKAKPMPGTTDIIVATFDELGDLIEDIGDDTAKWVKKLCQGETHMHFDAADDYHADDILRQVEKDHPEEFKRLLAAIAANYEDEIEDAGFDEITTVKELKSFMEETNVLESEITNACATGQEIGAESSATNALFKAIESNPCLFMVKKDGEKTEYVKDFTWDTPCVMAFAAKDILAHIPDNENDIESGDVCASVSEWPSIMDDRDRHSRYDSYRLKVEEPRYGWDGFDMDAAVDRFMDDLSEWLDQHE